MKALARRRGPRASGSLFCCEPEARGPAPLLRVLLALALLMFAGLAYAAPNYPALTGRVVDAAGVIPEATRSALTTKLRDLEDKSGIQLVVATVKSLDGHDVESYANGLFRAWKLGEAKKNNGVLFLVAPNDRKMRIEVGYGLEGSLTDALSKVILTSAVAPKFKTRDFGAGVEAGVAGVIEVLSGDSAEWTKRAQAPPQLTLFDQLVPLLIFALFIFIFIYMARNAASGPDSYRRYRRGGPPIIILPPGRDPWDSGFGGGSSGGSWGGSWGGGGGFDGGFSGGGGSSGGGGASGDW